MSFKFGWSPAYLAAFGSTVQKTLDDYTYILRMEAENASRHATLPQYNTQLATVDNPIVGVPTALLLDPSTTDYLAVLDSDDWAGITTIGTYGRLNTLPSVGSHMYIYNQRVSGAEAVEFRISNVEGDLYLNFGIIVGGVSIVLLSSVISLTTDVFKHFGVTHDGTTWKLWYHGVVVDSVVDADVVPNYTQTINIGRWQGNGFWWDGYLTHFEITKGSAIDYSVLPTTKIDVTEYHVLALDFEGTLIDASDDFEASALSKWWDTTLNGGSAFLDSGNLELSNDTSAITFCMRNLNYAGEFTQETDATVTEWGNTSGSRWVQLRSIYDNGTEMSILLERTTGSSVTRIQSYDGSTSALTSIGVESAKLKIERDALNNVTTYYDIGAGWVAHLSSAKASNLVQAGHALRNSSATTTAEMLYFTLEDNGVPIQIIADPARIIDSAEPGIYVEDTLRLSFDGADEATEVTDDANSGSAPHTLSFVGNAKLDASTKKFGTASLEQTASTDRVTIDDGLTDFDFDNSASYTVEGWIKWPTNTSDYRAIFGKGGGGASWSMSDGHQYILAVYQQKLTLQYNHSGLVKIAQSSVHDFTDWTHVRWNFHNPTNTTKLYIDGSFVYSGTAESMTRPATRDLMRVGNYAGDDAGWIGHIDDLRVRNSAESVESFDVPTRAYSDLDPAATPIVPDISGQENDAVQATVANQALFDLANDALSPDGSNDFYTLPNNALNDQDFTMFIVAKFGTGQRIITNNNPSGYGGWVLERNTSTDVIVFATITNAGAGLDVLQTATGYNDGDYHLVTVRKEQGGDLELWIDGVLADTVASSSDVVYTGMVSGGDTMEPSLFRWRSSSPQYYGSPLKADLYMNSAVSDGDRTTIEQLLIDKYIPVIPPATLDDYTYILRMEAENASRHLVTADGNAQLDGNGACVFNGTDSRLTSPYSPNFSLEDGDYSISFFITFNSLALQMLTQSNSTNSGDTGSWWIRKESDNSIRFLIDKGGSAESLQSSASVISADTEYFLEVVRQYGGINRIFLNGVQIASGSDGSYNAVANSGFDIGAQNDDSGWVDGAIKRFHLQKGLTTRTTGDSYTPPSASDPIVVDAYTVLALDFEGAEGWKDSSGSKHNVEVNGAELDGNNACIFVDSETDYLEIADSDDVVFTTAFTIAMWFNLADETATTPEYFYNQVADGNNYFECRFEPASDLLRIECYSGGGLVFSHNFSVTYTEDTWEHLALVWTGTTISLYHKGNNVGGDLSFNGTMPNINAPINIGRNGFGGGASYLHGSLSRYQVVNGTALWVTDFTPPSRNEDITVTNDHVLALNFDGPVGQTKDRILDSAKPAYSFPASDDFSGIGDNSGTVGDYNWNKRWPTEVNTSYFSIVNGKLRYSESSSTLSGWKTANIFKPNVDYNTRVDVDHISGGVSASSIYFSTAWAYVSIYYGNYVAFKTLGGTDATIPWDNKYLNGTFELNRVGNTSNLIHNDVLIYTDTHSGISSYSGNYGLLGRGSGSTFVFDYDNLVIEHGDGSPVQAVLGTTPIVPDISGNENDVVQATSTKQPEFYEDDNSILFDGAELMTLDRPILSGSWTAYSVVNPIVLTSGYIWSQGTIGTSTLVGINFESDGKLRLILNGADYYTAIVYSVDTNYVITVVHDQDAPSTKVYLDGTLILTENVTLSYAGNGFAIGASVQGASRYVRAKEYANLFRSGADNDTDRAEIETLLINKYNI